ncbi:MAG: fumarylacetoacetate hydrolase family protein [Acidobacteria bacterium]|nr:fumarylacetoacetate hydrolase family protein [Acidobacteriota bacterium]
MKHFLRIAGLLSITLALHPSGWATKLVTYSHRGAVRLGAFEDGGVIDLNRAYTLMLRQQGKPRAEALANALVPPTMLDFLQGEDDAIRAASEAIRFVKQEAARPGGLEKLKQEGVWFDSNEVVLKAPLPNPPHLLAIGLNYRAHIEEIDKNFAQPIQTTTGAPSYPVVFTKEGTIIGPGETIRIPRVVEQPDYEGELAVVIGKPARNVSRQRALDYVAGYMIFNDVTARDLQNRVSQWTVGKSPDTFSVMGPYLVLKDEVPDPQALAIRTRIGNEVLQDSRTDRMIFSVAELIENISQVMTLTPGTIIATGTPEGVGAGRKPPRWLRPGETIVVAIEKLGELANPIAGE